MPKLPLKARQALRRRTPPKVLWRLGALLTIQALNAWMSTLNCRMFRYDPTVDPASSDYVGPAIYVFWHEYIPFPVYVRPNCRLAMLLSQHQDAELLSHIAGLAGFETVRGSTSRGGTSALRELIERGRGMSLVITPDGPRGPRRRLAQGCIYLSSRLQLPIVPIGIGYDRPWRNRRAWDHFAIPRPYSRCRAVVGPRLQVAPGIERPEIELNRQWIEDQLEFVTTMAERWAASEFEIPNAEVVFRSAAMHYLHQANRVPTLPAAGKVESEPGLKIAG